MKVSIVIPNYNGADLIRENLPKVFNAAEHFTKETKEEVEVIVIDDASKDNSIAEIKNQKSKIKNAYQKLKIIQNSNNLGFASTVNKAVKESSGEVIILLNTDVVPKKDFMVPLLRHFVDENVFAVGCMDKSIENGKTVLRGRGIGKWNKGFLQHARGEADKTNTLWVSGGSGAFRKSFWDKLGGFNTLYNPFYWEDIDLSYRALKSGYQIIFEPKSIVLHEHEKGAIKSRYSDIKIKTIAYRNQFIFVWENATDMNLQLAHVLWLPYHFISRIISGDIAFVCGFIMAFILLPKIIQSSFRSQIFFTKSDKDVIEEFIA